jgi:hypothetical protein
MGILLVKRIIWIFEGSQDLFFINKLGDKYMPGKVTVNIVGGANGSAQNGTVNCSINVKNYTITTNNSSDYPVVSLITPFSDSTIIPLSIYDVTNTSFSVTLSEAPKVTGYKIVWSRTIPNPSGISTQTIVNVTDVFSPTTVSISGSYIPDGSAFNFARVTLDNNVTLQTPINLDNGKNMIICVRQQAGKNYSISFASSYKFPGGIVPTMPSSSTSLILDIRRLSNNYYVSYSGEYPE